MRELKPAVRSQALTLGFQLDLACAKRLAGAGAPSIQTPAPTTMAMLPSRDTYPHMVENPGNNLANRQVVAGAPGGAVR